VQWGLNFSVFPEACLLSPYTTGILISSKADQRRVASPAATPALALRFSAVQVWPVFDCGIDMRSASPSAQLVARIPLAGRCGNGQSGVTSPP